MPAGIPVASVAINGAKNAALLAIQIISLFDINLKEKLKIFRKKQHAQVRDKNSRLSDLGANKYLSND